MVRVLCTPVRDSGGAMVSAARGNRLCCRPRMGVSTVQNLGGQNKAPKALKRVGNGEGVSPPQPTRAPGERRMLLSGVRGGAPAT